MELEQECAQSRVTVVAAGGPSPPEVSSSSGSSGDDPCALMWLISHATRRACFMIVCVEALSQCRASLVTFLRDARSGGLSNVAVKSSSRTLVVEQHDADRHADAAAAVQRGRSPDSKVLAVSSVAVFCHCRHSTVPRMADWSSRSGGHGGQRAAGDRRSAPAVMGLDRLDTLTCRAACLLTSAAFALPRM